MRARTEETVPAQATPEQNGTSSELKTKSKTSKSPASQEVKMTPYLNTFATQFNLITAEIDSIYNPLTEYGKKTDAHDNFIHKTLNALHLRTPHTFISGNLTVEKAMKNNKYRKMIDCFLDERYPQYGLDTSTIERSPEFIIRSIRLLLLNIEHFVTEPVSKKKHLEIVQHVCFYVLAQECIWAADASFWQVFFSQDTELYHQFNELLENLIQMLKEDINELKDSSEANKLPQALNGLKKIAEELLILFPMTLLQHLLDRPIPESFLTHMDMTSLFKNESLSFYEFKKIKLPKNFNAVLIDPSKPDCPDLFNLVKHAFFAPTRKRLRQELEQTAVKEALAYTQNLSQNTRAPSGLLSQQPEESKALMYASREEPSYSNLSFHPSVNTLSSETKELSDRYHHNVNQYAQESLIAAVLPIALRNIYNNPDAYNPTLVNHLLSYIKNISKGIYLIEELIHLIENLKDSIKFHPHGGNMVSKPALPLANVRGSAITAFLNLLQIGVALQTQSRELRKAVITLRANIPFSQNAYQALVNAHDMSVKIHTEGLAHLKDMSDSLTIESICDDSLDAIRTYASMVVRQKALQRMCVNTDPFTYFLA
ncbi:MAG TPA: hypothetical protein VLH77_07270, partial [Gammaproteobacteria bacterium]|nr:hypothetical protein [Gammaproteobacteria bacterium]